MERWREEGRGERKGGRDRGREEARERREGGQERQIERGQGSPGETRSAQGKPRSTPQVDPREARRAQGSPGKRTGVPERRPRGPQESPGEPKRAQIDPRWARSGSILVLRGRYDKEPEVRQKAGETGHEQRADFWHLGAVFAALPNLEQRRQSSQVVKYVLSCK